jgi:N-acetyl sugar amidotransferase
MHQNILKNLKWCSRCLSMSTRPRITFNDDGVCNACLWTESKKTLNWGPRQKELDSLIGRHKKGGGEFDCLVPVSGGKDGSYVAHTLKTKYGLNVLTLTVTPPLPLALGEENLKAFVKSGFNHISINPPFEPMRVLNKTGFKELGFPYYGWLTAIQSAVVRMAVHLDIGIIFYGEDGEVEYGGSTETNKNPIYNMDYMKKIYLEGGYERVIKASGLSDNELYFFRFPEVSKDSPLSMDITHWSYFENWDPYRNYLVAKEFCGLKEADSVNAGTFTNFSQNDQALYALHTYLMYLKFGFGRANQDACIEIRRGAMDRDQAVNLVRLYDGQYPNQYLEQYLDYFEMSEAEFEEVLDKWANKDLFEKKNKIWQPKFTVE